MVPLFLIKIGLIALKGFWAGVTALLVSKAIAFKVFYSKNEYDKPQRNRRRPPQINFPHHVPYIQEKPPVYINCKNYGKQNLNYLLNVLPVSLIK